MHRGSHGNSTSDVSTDNNKTNKEHKDHKEKDHKDNKSHKDTWNRPRSGSESSRNPVSKVMDLIRHRSHSALNSDDKKKSVS